MVFDSYLNFFIIFCYSLATLLIFVGTLSMRTRIKDVANIFTLIGFFLHTVSSFQVLFLNSYDELSFGYFVQLLSWFLIFVYLVGWKFLRVHILSLTAAPFALLLYLFSLRLTGITDVLPEQLSGLFFWLHICSIFLSIGFLALAFTAGLFFVYLENMLKKKTLPFKFSKNIPALTTFDKVNKLAVIAGFPLYTLGLIVSFLWFPVSNAFNNPKVILSTFIWFLYAFLFYQRTALGYKGRKTAIMAIIIFLLCVLSFGISLYFAPHGKELLNLL